jgi:hypothetical protein
VRSEIGGAPVSLTCREQRGVGVDGCDGLHALVDDGIAYRVGGVGAPQRLLYDLVHVVAGATVPRPQRGQHLQQLDLRAATG